MTEPNGSADDSNRPAQPAKELVSEPITPQPGTFDVSRMARGEPGLPTGFTWRGESTAVSDVVAAWKQSSREGGAGELYLRRHYYRIRMGDGRVWTVYFIRQAARGGNPKKRWFLYSIETE